MPDPFWETLRADGSRVIHVTDHAVGVAVQVPGSDGSPSWWRIRGTDLEGPLLRPLALELCGRVSLLFSMEKDATRRYVRKPHDVVVRRDRVGRNCWSVEAPVLRLGLRIDEVLVAIDELTTLAAEAA